VCVLASRKKEKVREPDRGAVAKDQAAERPGLGVGDEVPPRPDHLPSYVERNALLKLRSGHELPLGKLSPTGHSSILKMIAKGWIVRGTASGSYRITPEGEAALRAKIP
jgi:hypothetical protein